MNRSDLFEKALMMSREKYKSNPDCFILKAIIAQLEYLVAVTNNNMDDLSQLKTIIIGRMTAYDIDHWDSKLADVLHLVAEEVRKMNLESRR